MAVFRIEKNKDYVVMSNHPLRDKRITLKAKGLMAFMLSNKDDWDYTLVGLSKALKEGVSAIRSTVTELENYGYVSRRKLRDAKGKFIDIEYTIYEYPVLDSPSFENRIMVNPTLESDTQINTIERNTKEIITNDNKYQSNLIPEDSELDYDDLFPAEDDEKDEMDIDSYDFWLKRIHQQIEYESLEVSYADDIKMINEMVEIIIETLLSDKQMDFINRSNYPISLVKNRYLSLEYQHIQYILECFHNTTKEREIKNVKQYLKTMLFNAPVTIDTHYTAKVNKIMPWRHD